MWLAYPPEVRFLVWTTPTPTPRPDFVNPCEGTERTLKQRGRAEPSVAMPAATYVTLKEPHRGSSLRTTFPGLHRGTGSWPGMCGDPGCRVSSE